MYMNNPFSPPSQQQQMEMHNAFNQQYGYRPHMSPSPNPIPSQSSQRPSQPVVQDSPDESSVEEVVPVKRKYVRKRQLAKQNDKYVNEPWTPDEEAALCKAWINTFENNKDGNGKKTNRFWMKVTTYFHKETGSAKRSLESVNCKWKNQIRPEVSQFYEMYNSVQDRQESGACKSTIYQKAEKEYHAYYNSAFQLVECWNVLKDHKKWKKVEYPMYLKAKYHGSKKSRTSGSASDSAHNGLNLNDEAADLGDEEIEESRPMAPLFSSRNKASFEYEYLRKPTQTDIEKLYAYHEEKHGFPGMGDYGSDPFILLEAVASQDLWIWHAFFGVAGSNNDINVIRQSPLLNDLKEGKAPDVAFVANDVHYKWRYYLTDGIYPEWSVFIRSISHPGAHDTKRIRYMQAHEAARKDVKRAFGVLNKKWAIIKTTARS
nr:protein ALP1-like isoform X1 [Tanacetum cinerariifolium]